MAEEKKGSQKTQKKKSTRKSTKSSSASKATKKPKAKKPAAKKSSTSTKKKAVAKKSPSKKKSTAKKKTTGSKKPATKKKASPKKKTAVKKKPAAKKKTVRNADLRSQPKDKAEAVVHDMRETMIPVPIQVGQPAHQIHRERLTPNTTADIPGTEPISQAVKDLDIRTYSIRNDEPASSRSGAWGAAIVVSILIGLGWILTYQLRSPEARLSIDPPEQTLSTQELNTIMDDIRSDWEDLQTNADELQETYETIDQATDTTAETTSDTTTNAETLDSLFSDIN